LLGQGSRFFDFQPGLGITPNLSLQLARGLWRQLAEGQRSQAGHAGHAGERIFLARGGPVGI
jgi:hypothetical protein